MDEIYPTYARINGKRISKDRFIHEIVKLSPFRSHYYQIEELYDICTGQKQNKRIKVTKHYSSNLSLFSDLRMIVVDGKKVDGIEYDTRG